MIEEVPGPVRQPARRWFRKVLWIGVALLILGEAGHLLLDWAKEQLAHHLFHMVFGLGAGVVFFAYVARDIRRNGWPSFSWRLRPPSPPDAVA
jgi:hypothetical protein